MKIRTGFVSNSSTSRFCVFGIYAAKKDILVALNFKPAENERGCEHKVQKTHKFCHECGKPVWVSHNFNEEDIPEELAKYGLQYLDYGCYDCVGVEIEGLDRPSLLRLTMTAHDGINKLFPGKNATVISGECEQ
jgi:hypothetical protein